MKSFSEMGKAANQTKAVGGKVKIEESFKAQAITGDIDLSNKNISDNHCM
jgi:hypothetical protein